MLPKTEIWIKFFIFSLTRWHFCGKLYKHLNGEMSEWFKELVLKTSDRESDPEFESLSLRHSSFQNKFISDLPYNMEKYSSWPKRRPC